MNYIEKLRALLDRFQQNEIADLLGVTERAIQFWIADEHPKVPFVKTQRKIDELYTNLIIEGKTTEELRGLPGREDQTFLEKRKKAKINPTARNSIEQREIKALPAPSVQVEIMDSTMIEIPIPLKQGRAILKLPENASPEDYRKIAKVIQAYAEV